VRMLLLSIIPWEWSFPYMLSFDIPRSIYRPS
jgi:hypothetical protein